MWFNPMIFIYQKRITLVHEYISDAVVAKSETKEAYINNLLSNFFQVENISFINQFYKQTFIKKRIIMIKKTQSKKMYQLKYLVLIPVLASMLFYSSCTENSSSDLIESKKELQTRYFELNEGVEVRKGEKETYLDSYFGTGTPEGVEVSYSELTANEKSEYDEFNDRFYKLDKSEFSDRFVSKIYQGNNNRKILATIINFSKNKRAKTAKNEMESGDVSFLEIEKSPTFPGCEEGDKKCFSRNIQMHFGENFNSDLPNSLGLDPGKKRVFIAFKIDKEGAVVDVKARAPHPKIKNEVIRVISILPKMIPGEHEGKKVAVKYSIPFTLVIDGKK